MSKRQMGKLRLAGVQWRDQALALPFYPLPFEVEPAQKAVAPGSIPTGPPTLCPEPAPQGNIVNPRLWMTLDAQSPLQRRASPGRAPLGAGEARLTAYLAPGGCE